MRKVQCGLLLIYTAALLGFAGRRDVAMSFEAVDFVPMTLLQRVQIGLFELNMSEPCWVCVYFP